MITWVGGLREKGLEPEGLLQSQEELEKFMKSQHFLDLDSVYEFCGICFEGMMAWKILVVCTLCLQKLMSVRTE
jgi:hypothetical protein